MNGEGANEGSNLSDVGAEEEELSADRGGLRREKRLAEPPGDERPLATNLLGKKKTASQPLRIREGIEEEGAGCRMLINPLA